MDDVFSTMFGILAGLNGAGRQDAVGHDEVGDYTIDTCYTVDQGWETAVWKGEHDMIIVGRYASKEDAKRGHDDWCAVCAHNPVKAWSVQCDCYEYFDPTDVIEEE